MPAHARRRLGSWRGHAPLPVVLGVSVALLGACAPGPAPDVDDARACPGSNVDLVEALDRFAIPLPPTATDVRFYSTVHPLFGEYVVELSFSAPPAEVASFVAEATRSREGSTDSEPLPPQPDPCLRLESFAPTSVTDDYGPKFSPRTIAVDDHDPERAVVYATAMDHP